MISMRMSRRVNPWIRQVGRYGIQGIGGQMIECMEGYFFAVMRLPMHRLSRELARDRKYCRSSFLAFLFILKQDMMMELDICVKLT